MILISCNDVAVDLCFPQHTEKGVGYYNLESRAAIDVVKDRSQRRMLSMELGVFFSCVFIFLIHIIFLSVLMNEGSLEFGFWIMYIGFGFVFFPMMMKMQLEERTMLEQTIENAKQYRDANAMEGGGYSLFNEKKKPRPKDLIGAAACGYIGQYKLPYRYVHVCCPTWWSFFFFGQTLLCVCFTTKSCVDDDMDTDTHCPF